MHGNPLPHSSLLHLQPSPTHHPSPINSATCTHQLAFFSVSLLFFSFGTEDPGQKIQPQATKNSSTSPLLLPHHQHPSSPLPENPAISNQKSSTSPPLLPHHQPLPHLEQKSSTSTSNQKIQPQATKNPALLLLSDLTTKKPNQKLQHFSSSPTSPPAPILTTTRKSSHKQPKIQHFSSSPTSPPATPSPRAKIQHLHKQPKNPALLLLSYLTTRKSSIALSTSPPAPNRTTTRKTSKPATPSPRPAPIHTTTRKTSNPDQHPATPSSR